MVARALASSVQDKHAVRVVGALRYEMQRERLRWACLWGVAVVTCLCLSALIYPSICRRVALGRHFSVMLLLALPLALASVIAGPLRAARRRFQRLQSHRLRVLAKSLPGEHRPHSDPSMTALAARPPTGVEALLEAALEPPGVCRGEDQLSNPPIRSADPRAPRCTAC